MSGGVGQGVARATKSISYNACICKVEAGLPSTTPRPVSLFIFVLNGTGRLCGGMGPEQNQAG